jgi:hypothetical protein
VTYHDWIIAVMALLGHGPHYRLMHEQMRRLESLHLMGHTPEQAVEQLTPRPKELTT